MSNLLETVVGKQRKQHSEKGMLNRKRCNLFRTQKNEDEFYTNLNLRTIHSTITVKLTPPFIYSPRNVLTVLCVFLFVEGQIPTFCKSDVNNKILH